MKAIIYEFVVKLKQLLLPRSLQEYLEDLFFLRCPLFLISFATVEYRGYLRHYRPTEGNFVVDCGAWKGHFTILISRLVGSEGRVVSLEPQPVMYSHIINRVHRLKLENVIVVNCGLHSFDTSVVTPRSRSSAFRTYSSQERSNSIDSQTVQLRTLDNIIKEVRIPRVDFIKMDIEGSEIEAIDGMHNTLKGNNVRLAIATYHMREGKRTAETVENKLKSLGYTAFTEFPQHLTTYGIR
jgi:FkbM family methyltransferase